jgi:hypothetical protein
MTRRSGRHQYCQEIQPDTQLTVRDWIKHSGFPLKIHHIDSGDAIHSEAADLL